MRLRKGLKLQLAIHVYTYIYISIFFFGTCVYVFVYVSLPTPKISKPKHAYSQRLCVVFRHQFHRLSLELLLLLLLCILYIPLNSISPAWLPSNKKMRSARMYNDPHEPIHEHEAVLRDSMGLSLISCYISCSVWHFGTFGFSYGFGQGEPKI